MLISFAFENYKSFADLAQLSMIAHRHEKTLPGAPVLIEGQKDIALLPAVAIYGPNAAGKTNVIYALQYMRRAVIHSQEAFGPTLGTRCAPHFLNIGKESFFEIVFIRDEVRYRYGFACTSEIFTREWLYSYPLGKERRLFERETEVAEDTVATTIKYGRGFTGLARDHESSRRRTRPNSLFVAASAQDNQAESLVVHKWFHEMNIQTVDGSEIDDTGFTARMCFEYPDFKKSVMDLLRAADSNISDIEIVQRDTLPSDALDGVEPQFTEFVKSNLKYTVEFIVDTPSGKFNLPLGVQSRGVQKLFQLAALIVFGHQYGELTVIDEIEASLHPHVAAMLIGMYQAASLNKRHAQLIFSTHDTRFLNPAHLRRDQVWFVERTEGQSHLYPLTEFSPRKDENLERGYLRGRYGAIPTLGFDPGSFQAGGASRDV